MNREFSKGIRLYLTEHARVQSTFAGHYDLGAYLVIVLNLLLSIFFLIKKKLPKLLVATALILGTWLMVMTASRTSFMAYLGGASLVILLVALVQPTWPKKIWWGISRGLGFFALVGIMMLYYGEDMYERFLQVLEGYPALHSVYHETNRARKEIMDEPIAFILGDTERFKAEVPENGISTEEAERVLVSSDERPVRDKPSDVYVDVPDLVEVSTTSATGEVTTTLEERDRVFSDCAKQRGLSLCIRLETLWPKAVAGFMTNPLLGTGYATLNKDGVTQFTEAESTDNNFLRTLGETGLLGFVTFYGVIVLATIYIIRRLPHTDSLGKALAFGYFGGTAGLLLNAVYIDVFAASKVAFTYWALTGAIIGYYLSEYSEPAEISASSTLKLPVTPKIKLRSKTSRKKK